MTTLDKSVGKKGSLSNKLLSLFVCTVLVLSMPNISAFGEVASGDQGQGSSSSGQGSGDQQAGSDAVQEAVVSIQAVNAHIVVDGTAVTASTVKVSAGEDFSFTVQADAGFEVRSVSATDSATGATVAITDSAGVYTVAAKDVGSTLVVTVTASAVQEQKAATQTLQDPQAQPEIVAADASETVTLTVEYFYSTGGRASNTWQSEYVPGESFQAPVPQLAGYNASCAGYTIQYDSGTGTYYIAGTITQDTAATVIYTPQDVTYKVTHKFEQLNGTYNDEVDTVNSTVGQWTTAQAKVRAGYTSTAPVNVVLVDNSTDIVIIYTLDTHKLSYNSNGGSYVSPSYAKYGATVAVTSTVPAKNGYTFAGWYKDSALTQPAGASLVLTAETVLYAKWTPKSVGYTVVFWKQKVTDSKTATNAQKTYDYAESATGRTATVGTSVSPTSADQSKSYTGFTYNGTNSVSVTVAADGTTVLNVYYDRNLMTLNFYTRSGSNWSISQTFTGLYGSTLASNNYTWPTGYSWNEQQNGFGTTQTFLDAFIFPDAGTTYNLYGQNTQSGSTIRHYKQNIDGTWNSTATNEVSASGGTFNITNKYNGFTVAQYRTYRNSNWSSWQNCSPGDTVSSGYTILEVRHTRNNYNLAYYNYNTISNTVSVPYQSLLGSYATYTPPHPAGLPSYYAFIGWYKDPTLTTLFNFATETMPSSGVTVYAKWAAPIYSISFETAGGTPVAPQNITAGQTATAPADPTREGYEFQGWYTDSTYSTPYDFNAPITQNTVIYAKWKQITATTYTVKYLRASNGTPVFPEEVYAGVVGTSVNAVAKQHATLIPDATTKTLASLSYNASTNVITFLYSEPHDVYYKVQYVNYATGDLIEEEPPIATSVNQVVVYSKDISGYEVTADWQQKALADETDPNHLVNNIITFYCKPIITVTASTASKTYDGTPLTAGGTYTGNVRPGDNVQITTVGSITNVGSVANTVGNVKVMRGSTDVTDNYVIHKSNGTLTVNPVAITVTANSATKAYDGTALTDGGWSVTSGAFVGADGIASAAVTGTQTAVGSSANTLESYTLKPGTVAGNYQITKADGTLTVTNATGLVTITANDAAKTYDGTALTNATAAATGLPAGFTVEVTSTSAITDAGSTPNVIATYKIYDAAHSDVTSFFTNVTTADGTLTVNPVAITVTANSATKAYDGTALTDGGWSVTSGAFVGADGIASAAVTGTQTAVGSSANTLESYTLKPGTVAGNYQITKADGTLTVTNATGLVTITPAITPPVTPPTDDTPATVAPVTTEAPEVSIADDETPLAAPKAIECWVHWWILLGIVVTAAYSVAVALRRRKYTSDLAGWEDEVLGGRTPKNPQAPTPIGSAVKEA